MRSEDPVEQGFCIKCGLAEDKCDCGAVREYKAYLKMLDYDQELQTRKDKAELAYQKELAWIEYEFWRDK
jgi:formate hydrogenlyase subunit 6/NADH:ubiquinone oxidoreductase subunit I